MNGSYNPSRVIVGFEDWYALDDFRLRRYVSRGDMASAALARLSGFISVLHTFDFLNAALAEVDPSQSDRFLVDALALDEVEYCDHDYLLQVCAFPDSLIPAHQKGISQNQAFAPHRSTLTRLPPFYGASVALIDTGISPHPYLPALSFKQALETPFVRHPSLQNPRIENFIRILVATEASFPNAYTTQKEHSAFTAIIDSELKQFTDSEWKSWAQKLQSWMGNRSSKPAPTIPHSRSILGALRIISPQSWNFVEESPNILDYDGHGTGMAGCIAALPPISQGIIPELFPALTASAIQPTSFDLRVLANLDHEVTGLAPYAELIVLKCLDSRKSNNSTLSILLRALAHCLHSKPDCVYFGLALKNLPQSPLLALSRLTAQMEAAGITMFAPAGNDGQAGLCAPAASPGVLPVTAVEWHGSQGNCVLAPYSSFANTVNNEAVEFCACGGTKDQPIQLLSNEFGFAYDCGTSISAAIVTSVFLHELCLTYKLETESMYRNQVGTLTQNLSSVIEKFVVSWSPSLKEVAAARTTMRSKAINVSGRVAGGVLDPKFGYGLASI